MDRTTAMGLWHFGGDFFRAGELLIASKGTEEIFIPTYYLYCHAIELGLKAFLRTKGFTSDELKKIKKEKTGKTESGHNLEVILGLASDNGLDKSVLKDEHIEVINWISPYYKGKEFEYIKRGYKELPKIVDLRNAAASIFEGRRTPGQLGKRNSDL